jgi:integrase
MGRAIAKLSALKVEQLSKKQGAYGDGGGLWLYVSSPNASSWIFRFAAPLPYLRKHKGEVRERPAGTMREMGLGAYPAVPLVKAREIAADLRRLLVAGKDPIAQRDAIRAEEAHKAASAITFRAAADQYIGAQSQGWRNDKHGKQWKATLAAHVYPTIGDLAVQAIDVAMVHKVLEPIWSTIPETASRVRGRIESILDWASARGYRAGDNPARWRGHLENLFPRRSKLRTVKHHAALPYAEIAAFLKSLEAQKGSGAKALQFAILTAARTSEVLGATWGEIDTQTSVWTIPAGRMKAGREHRVPLTPAALKLLGDPGKPSEHVFTSPKSKHGLSNMAMLQTLRRMKRGDLTAHGFRSTFRDWVGECTSFPREIAEAALAHSVGDATEQAYRRGDALAKRRKLMEAWSLYCRTSSGGNVVNMRVQEVG